MSKCKHQPGGVRERGVRPRAVARDETPPTGAVTGLVIHQGGEDIAAKKIK
jgi:hypothetical protein